uniref:Uncharacterized protein n=1 Tax=Macrostomum lignano TaxID=282301 RepID=A0A1I8FE37_9PLAT
MLDSSQAQGTCEWTYLGVSTTSVNSAFTFGGYVYTTRPTI